MLKIIILHEIMEHMKSAKWLVGVLLAVALISVSTLINIGDYRQRRQDYLSAEKEMTGDRFYVKVFRPPQTLSVLVQGKDRTLGNQLQMTYLDLPARTSGYMGQAVSEHQRYLAGFSSVDLAFTFRVVLSLLVIFMTYRAVSEEKFRGTLKLMLSNRLPRHVLLLGKWLGGFLTVLLSAVLGLLSAVLIMLFHPAVTLSLTDGLRIACIFGISVLYLTCFYTMSLFVSVLVNRPAVSLMILLQAWIFLVILVPNLGVILSERLYRLPEPEELLQEKRAAFQPYEQEYNENREKFNHAVMNALPLDPEVRIKNVELSAKRAEVNYLVDLKFSKSLSDQAALAVNLAVLSPAVLYDRAVLRLARTGMDEYERFIASTERHWKTLVDAYLERYRNLTGRGRFEPPSFTYTPESAADSFQGVLLYGLFLVLFSTVFFALAYAGFMRKDVR